VTLAQSVRLILLLAALPLSPSGSADSRSDSPYPESSPLYQPSRTFLNRILALPELTTQLDEVEDAGQAFELGMKLSENGMRKLDTASLERRMAILARVVDRMDIEGCALLVRGERGEALRGADVLTAALAELDAQTISEWFDLAFEAVLAELRGAPTPPFDDNDIEKAMNALIDLLPASEAERFADALRSLPEGGDEDVCWAGKTLYQSALKLDTPHRAAVARALTLE
jgi:exonuclease VII small subunit